MTLKKCFQITFSSVSPLFWWRLKIHGDDPDIVIATKFHVGRFLYYKRYRGGKFRLVRTIAIFWFASPLLVATTLLHRGMLLDDTRTRMPGISRKPPYIHRVIYSNAVCWLHYLDFLSRIGKHFYPLFTDALTNTMQIIPTSSECTVEFNALKSVLSST